MVGPPRGDRRRRGWRWSRPNFLTEFNIFVMLRSFCVSLLVAFAQMVMLGVGQMNISVGALGGLVAVSLGGMMDALGRPARAGDRRSPWLIGGRSPASSTAG
jgi:ribose/xylose/arabinose/galactoside ABC-type transport system permease subunit